MRAALVGSLLAQRGQTLEVELPEDLPLVSGDKTRLTQVFVNLLANANKFAPDGSVRARRRRGARQRRCSAGSRTRARDPPPRTARRCSRASAAAAASRSPPASGWACGW